MFVSALLDSKSAVRLRERSQRINVSIVGVSLPLSCQLPHTFEDFVWHQDPLAPRDTLRGCLVFSGRIGLYKNTNCLAIDK